MTCIQANQNSAFASLYNLDHSNLWPILILPFCQIGTDNIKTSWIIIIKLIQRTKSSLRNSFSTHMCVRAHARACIFARDLPLRHKKEVDLTSYTLFKFNFITLDLISGRITLKWLWILINFMRKRNSKKLTTVFFSLFSF